MIHTATFTIRTFHCDSFGHVNNARHLELMEEARWQFGEAIGLTTLLREAEIGFIIMDMKLRFRSPVFEGQSIRVESSLQALGSSSGELKQSLWIEGEKRPAVQAVSHFLLIDRQQQNQTVSIEGAIRDCMMQVLSKADDPS